MGKIWTKAQDQIIIREYGIKTAKEIGLLINMPTYDVQRRAKKLGVWINTTELPWSQKEDTFLKENHNKLTAREIGKKLNRGIAAVKKRTRTLKIANEPEEIWTDEEIEILKNNYLKLEYQEIAGKLLNRSKVSIEHKANKLNFKKNK